MGGLQKSGLMMAKALQLSGFSVEMCLLYSGGQFFNSLDGISVYRPSKQSKHLMVKWLQVIWHLRFAARTSKSSQVVVLGRYYGALAALALLLKRKTLLVISERNAPLFRMPLVYERFCDLIFAVRPPQLVLAQTKYAALLQRNRYPSSRVVSFYNLFEPIAEQESNRKNGKRVDELLDSKLTDKEHVLVFVVAGRFNDALKGIPMVLESFLELGRTDFRLLVAGGTVGEDSSVDAVISKYPGWNRVVEFLGRVEGMGDVFERADVFVLPSNSEGFPNALVEAMQRGLFCISAEFHSGVYEIIESENEGLVVPVNDGLAMRKALAQVLDRKINFDRVGNSARMKSQQFEMQNRLQEIKEVFCVS